MGKETKQFVVITDRGIMGRGMKADMVMARLLSGFLQVWNDEVFPVDVDKAGEKILAALEEMRPGDDDADEDEGDDLESMLRYLFGDDEDDADGEA